MKQLYGQISNLQTNRSLEKAAGFFGQSGS
jgi:hypothetical protein